MRIALLCPTRERIKDQKRLVNSLINTTSNLDNIRLYFGVDQDDPHLAETLKFENAWIKVIKIDNDGKFLGLGVLWNKMVKDVKQKVFMMTGDDMVFETKGWDIKVLKEFEAVKDNVLMVHCNDGVWKERFSVAPFIHRLYYDTFGYYVREEWKHGYHDTWIHDVYQRIGRKKYLDNVMIRHLHYTYPTTKIQADNVSKRLKSAFHEIDGEELFQKLVDVRIAEAEKLKGFIK